MKSKTNQAATAFSNTGPYTVRAWDMHGSGTLYRDGERVAIYGNGNDGEPFVEWFDSRRIVGQRASGSLIGQQDTPEAMALLAWYRAVEPEASADDDLAMHAAIARVVDGGKLAARETHVREAMRNAVLLCEPGDVRTGEASPFYTATLREGFDLTSAATEMQEDNPELIVLNLLPFDTSVALYIALAGV